MANICVNSVYLKGDKETLKYLANVFLKAKENSNRGFEKAQEILGFEEDDWGKSEDVGLEIVDDSKIEAAGVLYLYGCTAWSAIPKYFESLCEKYDLEYVLLEELDNDMGVYNDPESKWFPDNYILDLWDDFEGPDGEIIEAGYHAFKTESDLLQFVNTSLKLDHKPYSSAWSLEIDILDADVGNLITVTREGNQVEKPKDFYLDEELEELLGDEYDAANKDGFLEEKEEVFFEEEIEIPEEERE